MSYEENNNNTNTNNSKRKIVAVRNGENGSEISMFKLDDGSVISKEEAYSMVCKGVIEGFIPCVSKTGEGYLRSAADGDLGNNLQQYPRF